MPDIIPLLCLLAVALAACYVGYYAIRNMCPTCGDYNTKLRWREPGLESRYCPTCQTVFNKEV